MILRSLFVLVLCSLAFTAYAADGDTDVVTVARDIARGEMLGEADLVYRAVPAARAHQNVLRSIADGAGLEARRALRAGEILRANDLKRPTLVAKGSTVTMIYSAGGITLTAVGRAMTEAGVNEAVTVLNPASYRQVQAVAISPGTVRVGPAATGVLASVQ